MRADRNRRNRHQDVQRQQGQAQRGWPGRPGTDRGDAGVNGWKGDDSGRVAKRQHEIGLRPDRLERFEEEVAEMRVDMTQRVRIEARRDIGSHRRERYAAQGGERA